MKKGRCVEVNHLENHGDFYSDRLAKVCAKRRALAGPPARTFEFTAREVFLKSNVTKLVIVEKLPVERDMFEIWGMVLHMEK